MADTTRVRSAVLALFADNTEGAISPQDLRDLVMSLKRHTFRTITTDGAASVLTVDDDFALVNSGDNVNCWLPDPATCPGRVYTIKDTGGFGSSRLRCTDHPVDQSTLYFDAGGLVLTAISDGTQWYLLNRSS